MNCLLKNAGLYAAIACSMAFVIYRMTWAAEVVADSPHNLNLRGTYQLTVKDESRMFIGVDNPTTVTIGDKTFLTGKVCGDAAGMIKASNFTGSSVFVALDQIITIQEIKAK